MMGRRSDWKKAYITLAAGQEINFWSAAHMGQTIFWIITAVQLALILMVARRRRGTAALDDPANELEPTTTG